MKRTSNFSCGRHPGSDRNRWFQSGGVAAHEMPQQPLPDQAVRLMLTQIKNHNFDAAYARLANRSDVDKNAFIREFNGSYGSLLTYASPETLMCGD